MTMPTKRVAGLSLWLLAALSLVMLAGCSGGARQVASDSPAGSSSPVKETTEPNRARLIKIDRTVRCSVEGSHDMVIHYDKISVVSNANSGDGVSYLILHYQVSNEGKEPFSAATERFAIVTDDETKYTPDSQAVSAVQADRELVAEGESHELLSTSLQPGLKCHLFSAFLLPTSVLSKHLTLVCLGDDATALRLSLPIGNTQVVSEAPAARTTPAQNLDETPASEVSDKSISQEKPETTEDEQASTESTEAQSNVKSNSEAADFLVEHFSNLASKNYEIAYKDLGPEWKPKQSYSEFVSSAERGNWSLCNRPQNCVLKDNVLGADHAEVDLDMSGFSSDQSVIRFSLVRIDGSWKISGGKRVPGSGSN